MLSLPPLFAVLAPIMSQAAGGLSEAALVDSLCLEAQVEIAAGVMPNSADFLPSKCVPEKLVRLSYNRSTQEPVTRNAVHKGDMIQPWVGMATGKVRPGDVLTLSVADRFLRIERSVVALQSAAYGDQLFVKDMDGQILSVRYLGPGQ